MRLLLLCLAAALTLGGRPLQAALAETLTTSDIEDAIRLGQSGTPSPYPTYNPGLPGKPRGLVMAVVYTPFIRVALAAKAARASRRDFGLKDVTADLTQPVVYVAYRWYCCVDPVHGGSKADWNPHRDPVDYRIATDADQQFKGVSPRLPSVPLAVTPELALIWRFSDPLPYDDIVLIATYPIREFGRASDFVIYRRDSIEGRAGTHVVPGHVTPDDLAGWR
jgi:hypothetical protein